MQRNCCPKVYLQTQTHLTKFKNNKLISLLTNVWVSGLPY